MRLTLVTTEIAGGVGPFVYLAAALVVACALKELGRGGLKRMGWVVEGSWFLNLRD